MSPRLVENDSKVAAMVRQITDAVGMVAMELGCGKTIN
jgi:hypothetical protein